VLDSREGWDFINLHLRLLASVTIRTFSAIVLARPKEAESSAAMGCAVHGIAILFPISQRIFFCFTSE
jgi:hypothetical protein